MGNNLKNYLDDVVSWEVVARQYYEAYRMAAGKVRKGKEVYIRPEF